MISEEYIEIFNQASLLTRQGKLEEALIRWDLIVAPQDKPDKSKVVTGDFLGQAHMRKAWVLMDLERYEEALEIFLSEVMAALITQFSLETLYDYFFSYANTLGSLGRIEEMDDKFTRALNIASEEFGDQAKCEQCWQGLLTHARKHDALDYLIQESERCVQFSVNNGLAELFVFSITHAIEANIEKGNLVNAKELSSKYLKQATFWSNVELIGEANRYLDKCN